MKQKTHCGRPMITTGTWTKNEVDQQRTMPESSVVLICSQCGARDWSNPTPKCGHELCKKYIDTTATSAFVEDERTKKTFCNKVCQAKEEDRVTKMTAIKEHIETG